MCFLLWELSVSFYIFHRHRVCLVDRVDVMCSWHSWWEGFESSSLATLPLGLNCGFTSTATCGSPTWVCTCEGQAWRWCSCLGRRDSGSTRYSGELVARASGNSALEGYGNRCWPIHSCSLAWRIPLTEKTTVHRVAKSPAPPK